MALLSGAGSSIPISFAPRAVTGHSYAIGVVDKATGRWKWHRPDIDDAMPGGNGQLAGDQGTAPPVAILPDFAEDVSGAIVEADRPPQIPAYAPTMSPTKASCWLVHSPDIHFADDAP